MSDRTPYPHPFRSALPAVAIDTTLFPITVRDQAVAPIDLHSVREQQIVICQPITSLRILTSNKAPFPRFGVKGYNGRIFNCRLFPRLGLREARKGS